MKILFLLITLNVYFNVNAQRFYNKSDSINTNTIINEAPFVFEGICVSNQTFKRNGIDYTSSIFEIKKNLKGNLKIGTVEFITKGIPNVNNLTTVEHFFIGVIGVFFCDKSDYPRYDLSTNNLNVLQLLRSGVSSGEFTYNYNIVLPGEKSPYDPPIKGMGAYFYSLNELYSFLENKLNININTKGENDFINERFKLYIDDYNKRTTNRNIKDSIINSEQNTNLKKKTNSQQKQEIEKLINYKAIRVKQNKSEESLTYSFENKQITGTTTKYLEFDVWIKPSNSPTYLDIAGFYVTYNPNAFPQGPLYNGKAWVTLNSDLNDNYSILSFDSTQLNDNSYYPNVFTIALIADAFYDTIGDSYFNRILIQDSLKLVHIKMEILSSACSLESQIDFYNKNESRVLNYYSNSSSEPFSFNTQFDTLFFKNDLNFSFCNPEITSFSHSERTAGTKTNKNLSIYGSDFESYGYLSKVIFNNADNGLTVKLNHDDILEWSDNYILISIPSIIFDSTNSAEISNTPGSGKISIRTASNKLCTSQDSLNISYGVANAAYTAIDANSNFHFVKEPIHLVNNESNNGYTFYFNGNFTSNQRAKDCAIKAINAWKCLTGINLKIGKDTVLNDEIVDTICLLSFGSISTTARTYLHIDSCSKTPSTSSFFTLRDVDLVFNRFVTWNYDTTGRAIGTDSVSLYDVILHELGHVQLLTHVWDKSEIMYYMVDTINRKNQIISAHNSAQNGADYVNIESDKLLQSDLCFNQYPMRMVANCTSSTNEIHDRMAKIYQLNIYPNPFNNELSISYSLKNSSNIQIRLLDITGAIKQNVEFKNQNEGEYVKDIQMDNLSSGFYFLQVKINDNTFVEKLIKM